MTTLHRRGTTQTHFTKNTPLKCRVVIGIMGVAQKLCCVGGYGSCIGTWGGRNSPRPASIYLDRTRIAHFPTASKPVFGK